MIDKPKILFIWNYFYLESEKGDSRFAYLARLIVESGFDLEIVTSSFYHMKKVHRDISKDELDSLPYKVTFIDEPGYKKNISISRVKSMKAFNNGVKHYLTSLSYKPDIVYVPIPSIKLGLIADEYCKSNNIPLVIDVEDLWPESFKMLLKSDRLTKLVFRSWYKQADRLYKSADAVVTVSHQFMDRVLSVRNDNPPHEVVYIGSNFDRAKSVEIDNSIVKLNGDIWVTYIGTLSKSYDLKPFIDAIEILYHQGHNEYCLKILGDGPDLEKVKQYSWRHRGRVDFIGLLPYEQMIRYLKLSDYGINPIIPTSVASIINKVGDYASVGLPVINTQHCKEYIDLLESSNSGISILDNDPNKIAEFLLDQHKFNKEPIKAFNRKDNYYRIIDMIKGVLL